MDVPRYKIIVKIVTLLKDQGRSCRTCSYITLFVIFKAVSLEVQTGSLCDMQPNTIQFASAYRRLFVLGPTFPS